MEIDKDAVVEGVQNAITEVFDKLQSGGYRNYINEMITQGIATAVRDWLDENKESVLAAIQAAHRWKCFMAMRLPRTDSGRTSPGSVAKNFCLPNILGCVAKIIFERRSLLSAFR